MFGWFPNSTSLICLLEPWRRQAFASLASPRQDRRIRGGLPTPDKSQKMGRMCGQQFSHEEARVQQWRNRNTQRACVHAHCVNGGVARDHELHPKQPSDQEAVEFVARQRESVPPLADDSTQPSCRKLVPHITDQFIAYTGNTDLAIPLNKDTFKPNPAVFAFDKRRPARKRGAW